MTAWENPFLGIDSSVFRALPEVQCNGVPVTSEFVSYGKVIAPVTLEMTLSIGMIWL